MSRRHWTQAATCAVLGSASVVTGVEPLRREQAYIRGLSLTTYSLKRHMRWWWGKQTAGQWEVSDFLEYCARLNLDAAELTSYFFPDPVTPAALRGWRRRAHVLGLTLSGGAMGNNFSHPPDSEVTRAQMRYFRQWIDWFADLGVPVVRVFASRGRPRGASDDDVLRHVIANLEGALPYAEKRGVLLGLENHDFVINLDYLLRILNAIDSEWLGVIWDSANLAPTPDPYAELARIAPYALTAQVKVSTKVNGHEVAADYERLIRILQAAHYRGPLVLEYEEAEDPLTGIPKFLTDVRQALAVCQSPPPMP